MHLWPSIAIRDSFKISYLKKLEWNLQRMNSEKKRQSEGQSSDQKQTLLADNQRNGVASQVSDTPRSKDFLSGFVYVCKETLMILSCCYCCYCGGACVDEEES